MHRHSAQRFHCTKGSNNPFFKRQRSGADKVRAENPSGLFSSNQNAPTDTSAHSRFSKFNPFVKESGSRLDAPGPKILSQREILRETPRSQPLPTPQSLSDTANSSLSSSHSTIRPRQLTNHVSEDRFSQSRGSWVSSQASSRAVQPLYENSSMATTPTGSSGLSGSSSLSRQYGDFAQINHASYFLDKVKHLEKNGGVMGQEK